MNNYDLLEKDAHNPNARGGTELLQHRLYDGTVARELLEKCQILLSQGRALDPLRKHVFYSHEIPENLELTQQPDPTFLTRYDRFVMVSNWQMQEYNQKLGLQYQQSTVIKNSIHPIDISTKQTSDKIRLV